MDLDVAKKSLGKINLTNKPSRVSSIRLLRKSSRTQSEVGDMSFCGKKSAGSEDGCLTESRDLTNSTLRGETKTHSEKLSSKETQQFSNITGQGMKITATTGDSELAA